MLALPLSMSGVVLPLLTVEKRSSRTTPNSKPKSSTWSMIALEFVSRWPMSPLVPCTPYQSIITPSTPESFISSRWYSMTSGSRDAYGPICG